MTERETASLNAGIKAETEQITQIYEGTNQIQRIVIAKHVMG